jgi:protein-tyrosine-phosphatase/predicted ATP-grasp superfamily ATP-dependent carboligase
VDIAALSAADAPISSTAIRNFHRLPDLHTDPQGFREALLALIRANKFDTIMATQDGGLEALCQNYDELSTLAHLCCPPPHITARVLQKELTLETAARVGIRVPRSYVVRDDEGLAKIASHMSFPAVIKPAERKGAPGFKTQYFQNLSAMERWLESNATRPVLVQEYCPGAGVGIEFLIHKGEPIAAFQHRRLKELPATGGVSVVAIAEALNPELAEASLRLLRTLEWEGVAMVEFKYDASTGQTALMEINGRYWGSASLPMLAGVEFPVYQWQLAHGQIPAVPANYAVGMRWRWTPGYLSRCHDLLLHPKNLPEGSSFWKEVTAIPNDLSSRVRDALWTPNDPAAARAEIKDALRQHVKSDLRRVLKFFTPAGLLNLVRQARQFPAGQRSIFLKMRLAHVFGLRNERKRRVPRTARSFVFVCTGNIMRSPMCEWLLRREVQGPHSSEFRIQSAGLHATPGTHADPRAQEAARELGIVLDSHRAQAMTAAIVDQSDAIFAMDYRNLVELTSRFPAAQDKFFMMSTYADPYPGIEIRDPYEFDLAETRRCYATLAQCIQNLANSLLPKG